jgi:hypothetical protein
MVLLVDRQQEYLATPERHALALQVASRARHDANEGWNYQVAAIRDWGDAFARGGRAAGDKAIREGIAELAPLEARAAYAYRLIAMAERIMMGIESDYSTERIEGERRLARRLADEYEAVIAPIEEWLLDRIARIGGLPLLLADAEADCYDARNPVDGVVHELGRQANRLNPIRMAKAAEADVARRRMGLQGEMFRANEVARMVDAYVGQLDDLDFAFNEADALLIGDGEIRAVTTGGEAGDPRPVS